MHHLCQAMRLSAQEQPSCCFGSELGVGGQALGVQGLWGMEGDFEKVRLCEQGECCEQLRPDP